MKIDVSKRYHVFAGRYYYPCGGFEDYKFSVDNLEEIIIKPNGFSTKTLFKGEEARIDDVDWWHVLDYKTGRIIWSEEWQQS